MAVILRFIEETKKPREAALCVDICTHVASNFVLWGLQHSDTIVLQWKPTSYDEYY
jgi:hypothetical protein